MSSSQTLLRKFTVLTYLVLGLTAVMILSASPDANTPNTNQVQAEEIQSRLFRFVVLEDGRAALMETDGPKLIQMLQPEENTFLRLTIKSLQHVRKQHEQSQDLPFRLSLRKDGNLMLEDPAMHSELAVRAFGHTAVENTQKLLSIPSVILAEVPAACHRLEC
jgi:putative photosynthetic complex assembly protein